MKSKGILRGVRRYKRKSHCFAPKLSTSRITPSSVMPATRAKCQKSGRCFKHLDTHHRVCCDVPPRFAPATTVTTPSPMNILSLLPSVNSNSAEMLQHSTCTASAVAMFRHRQRVPSPATKATLCLSTSAEDWKLADSFQTTLVPEVFSLSSPEQMSSVLCEGIYLYFASMYGTKTTTTRRVKKRPLHNRALKEVERRKKDAKRELHLATKVGLLLRRCTPSLLTLSPLFDLIAS